MNLLWSPIMLLAPPSANAKTRLGAAERTQEVNSKREAACCSEAATNMACIALFHLSNGVEKGS